MGYISLQTNGYSCGIFASVRLEFWYNHRRFPTAVEFKQKDDEQFRLYIMKRIVEATYICYIGEK
jgi:Ulp1 family protease